MSLSQSDDGRESRTHSQPPGSTLGTAETDWWLNLEVPKSQLRALDNRRETPDVTGSLCGYSAPQCSSPAETTKEAPTRTVLIIYMLICL